MKKCIFAGTFDPFTVGHYDTVEKARKIFDEVVISVSENVRKKTLFSAEERAEMIRAVYEKETDVRVLIWEGAIVDLLKKEGTSFYVRGVRNTTDFDYENADFFASRDLDQEMITLYIPSEQKNLHISSTLVKNCISFGKPISGYVPPAVEEYLARRTAGKKHV